MPKAVLTALLLGILCALCSPWCRAAEAPAKPGEGKEAATAPTSRPVDQTSPQGTLKVFMLAVEAAETDKVRGCLHTTNDTEARYATAYAGVSISMGRLRSAAMARFGDKAAAVFRDSATRQKLIDAATVKEEGDRATVTVKGEASPYQLIKADGVWKLSIGAMIAKKSAKDIEAELDYLRKYTAAVNTTSSEIAAGKYETIEAAFDALTKRIESTK